MTSRWLLILFGCTACSGRVDLGGTGSSGGTGGSVDAGTGGSSNTGGSADSGGSGANATGGSSTGGVTTASGGASGSGGAGSGGVTGGGGAVTGGTTNGGAPSTGGTASAGGAAGSGGATLDSGAPDSGLRCNDNRIDGNETDIDCGGSCPPCARAQMCKKDADCSATAPGCDTQLGGCTCDLVTMTCAESHCADGRKDYGESDVDCGGQCVLCGPGKSCNADTDCAQSLSGCDPWAGCYCDALTSVCVYSHCEDHKTDFSESDLDCGGGQCNKCNLGQICVMNFDCASSACDAITLKCISNPCGDHHIDGNETDVDCGGGTCLACATGKKCIFNSDCQTSACATTVPHVCL